MTDLILNPKAEPEALEEMKDSPYHFEDTKWVAYQNQAMDSAGLGHLQFLAVGPRNTFKEAPKAYPDTQFGAGWKYQFIGWVDLGTGEVVNDED